MWTLRFHGGTLVVEGARTDQLPPGFIPDDRIGHPRGPAWRYAEVVLSARRAGIPFQDDARAWPVDEPLAALTGRVPRPYQAEALAAWRAAGRRGTVVLPTGAGKTFVAELCMADTGRATLVLAPTLDLVGQWHARLTASFGGPVGMLGGGHHELQRLTVSTYDSAWRHLPRYGDRFGLIVFDEVHHLPAPGYLEAAQAALAPFRLGLTATLEREDGREGVLDEVLGPVVYRKEITELSGDFLAEYRTERIEVRLGPAEQAAYDEARQTFTTFVASRAIRLGGPGGWQSFLREAARSKDGRAAFQAYQQYKRIAHGTGRKLDVLQTLLDREWGRRLIVFTHDNATAYKISRQWLLPCISHQTDVKERRAILDAFEAGELPALVTSRVLNEGVDLPAAEVAIVLSGTGTVREHVQRLGRILRPGKGSDGQEKQAVLYEIIAAGTSEEQTSARRRRHDAYRES
ncbi:MAG: DEAD/DEAH box helicase [Alphaproteobacteria bacterium]|nr:DEAD/DEAH box helicase [Alphaproteobacteria bacterium]